MAFPRLCPKLLTTTSSGSVSRTILFFSFLFFFFLFSSFFSLVLLSYNRVVQREQRWGMESIVTLHVGGHELNPGADNRSGRGRDAVKGGAAPDEPKAPDGRSVVAFGRHPNGASVPLTLQGWWWAARATTADRSPKGPVSEGFPLLRVRDSRRAATGLAGPHVALFFCAHIELM